MVFLVAHSVQLQAQLSSRQTQGVRSPSMGSSNAWKVWLPSKYSSSHAQSLLFQSIVWAIKEHTDFFLQKLSAQLVKRPTQWADPCLRFVKMSSSRSSSTTSPSLSSISSTLSTTTSKTTEATCKMRPGRGDIHPGPAPSRIQSQERIPLCRNRLRLGCKKMLKNQKKP